MAAQPSGHPGMQISHLNPQNLVLDSEGKRGWSNNLFGSIGECAAIFTTCLCPCIVHSNTNTRLYHLSKHGSPHPDGDETCGSDCIWYAVTCCCFVSCVLQTARRREIRRRYNISGGCCGDCLTSYCCHICGLIQEYREVELEEKSHKSQVR